MMGMARRWSNGDSDCDDAVDSDGHSADGDGRDGDGDGDGDGDRDAGDGHQCVTSTLPSKVPAINLPESQRIPTAVTAAFER